MVSNLFGYEDTLCGVCRGFGATVAECKPPHIRARAGISPSLPMSCGRRSKRHVSSSWPSPQLRASRRLAPKTTSWSEFETLAQYAQTEARIKPGMTDLRGI